MTYGDYVITEAGFGADLGAEKFYDIKCRKAGLQPKLTVIVATTQGLKLHGGVAVEHIKEPNEEGLLVGLQNLDRHIRNLQGYGQEVVVAFNRYATDTDEELELVRKHCEEQGVGFAINNAFLQGGEGATELAQLVVDTIEKKPSRPLHFVYEDSDSIKTKIEKVCKNIYGAATITFSKGAERKLAQYAEEKQTDEASKQLARDIASYPVCIAKTQYSFSADPALYGCPSDFNVHIRDIVFNCGAEMVVAIAGEILRMPGLPRSPQAERIDIVDGNIEGLS
jgi:formate--tetrahydrofolate ligase